MRTLWLNLSARCLSSFTGRFNRPTPSDSTPSSRLWCIPTQCAALPFLSGLSPLRSPLLHNPGVHAGALGFNPMLLPKLDQGEIPRSRDRGNSYRSNPGSPSIRGSGSCLRLCRVVFACYTPTGGSRPTPAGAGQGTLRPRISSRETGSAVPSRAILLILHTQAESGAYSRDSSRFPRRRPFIMYLYRQTAIGSVPSLSGHAVASRCRSVPKVRQHRTSGSPQGISSNGCCLFRYHHGPVNVRLSFPTPTPLLVCRRHV